MGGSHLFASTLCLSIVSKHCQTGKLSHKVTPHPLLKEYQIALDDNRLPIQCRCVALWGHGTVIPVAKEMSFPVCSPLFKPARCLSVSNPVDAGCDAWEVPCPKRALELY